MRLGFTVLRSCYMRAVRGRLVQDLIGGKTPELTHLFGPSQRVWRRARPNCLDAHSAQGAVDVQTCRRGSEEGGAGELVDALGAAPGPQTEHEREQVGHR